MSSPTQGPQEALAAVRHRIARAARAAGRAPEDVTLIAVSKQQPWERVQALLDAGHRVFGENRVHETLDRDSLAEALVKAIAKAGRAPELFVQVNTGEEPQKAGVAPHEVDAFLDRVRQTHGLNVSGLMCIPPADEEPAMHFALLRKIARRNGIERLSMGMSGDYETAVRFGATHVRVGSALFGAREGFAAKAASGQ